jgi:plasmid stabilization system protein ParE
MALSDLDEIFRYICNTLEAPSAAQNLLKEIDVAVNNLGDFPFSHRIYISGRSLQHEYRRFTVKNYSVFYTVINDVIEIRRVMYSKRDFDGFLE